MKQIIDFLRKVGLLHVSKGDYMTGEFDDRTAAPKTQKNSATPAATARTTPAEDALHTGRKILFWIAIALALLMLLMAFGAGESVFTMVIIWVIALSILWQWAFAGAFSLKIALGVFFVTFIISIIILPASDTDGANSTSASSTGKTSSHKLCKAQQLSKHADKRITLGIVALDNFQDDHTKATYTLDELDNLQYGYNAEGTQEGYYILSEICAGTETRAPVTLKAEKWNYVIGDAGAVQSSKGNYRHFTNKQDDGSMLRTIKEPGTYTLYAYISYDGKKWHIAKEHTFQVQ